MRVSLTRGSPGWNNPANKNKPLFSLEKQKTPQTKQRGLCIWSRNAKSDIQEAEPALSEPQVRGRELSACAAGIHPAGHPVPAPGTVAVRWQDQQHQPSPGTAARRWQGVAGGDAPRSCSPARRCQRYEARSVQTTGTTTSMARGTLRLQQELLLVKMGSGDSYKESSAGEERKQT